MAVKWLNLPYLVENVIYYAYDSSPLPQISKHVLHPRLFHLSRMLTMSTLSAVPKESTICTRIKCKTSISHPYSMQIKRLTFFRPSRPGGMREALRITWISSLLKQIARVNPNWFNIFHANKYVVNLISLNKHERNMRLNTICNCAQSQASQSGPIYNIVGSEPIVT